MDGTAVDLHEEVPEEKIAQLERLAHQWRLTMQRAPSSQPHPGILVLLHLLSFLMSIPNEQVPGNVQCALSVF
jgi:hypothetical protein